MKLNAHVRRRQANEHRILDELAKIIPPGEPASGVSYPAIAERLGESAYAVLSAKTNFERAGILRTSISYPPGRGRVSTWELTLPRDRAHEELSREHERQLSRPSANAKRKARSRDDGAGPLRPVPEPKRTEAEGLLRAAREYRDRVTHALEHIAEMRESGIEIDESSITVRRDDRLEAIAQVLPAVEELERERDRLADQVERWRSDRP